MDIIQSWLSLRSNAKHARRHYSSPLRAGHNAANLITDSTNNRYFADLSTAKKWFKANVHSILAIYGTEHRILKEMLYLGLRAFRQPRAPGRPGRLQRLLDDACRAAVGRVHVLVWP